ncbi:MAG: polynucleotide kinase-phosphatase, partial [Cyanobacteria bacterium P01_C01_bin.121]
DDENDQSATKDAFESLHYILEKRLAAGRLTVIDATNVQKEARRPLLALAKKYHFFSVAIALNLPESLCHERNRQRPNRQFGPHVVRSHTRGLRRSLKGLKREGFRFIYTLNSVDDIENVAVERKPLWNNRKHDHGPFDIIGDLHGCCDELEQLLQQLGYQPQSTQVPADSFWHFPLYAHPEGRRALFLGDLVDRGPRILDTLKLVRNMVSADTAVCIMGNHENKLLRLLNGRKVKVSYGLAQTINEMDAIEEERRDQDKQEIRNFLKSLISHYVLDEGKLVVAHAGLREELQGRGSSYVRDFALYGETTGETDEFGRRVRYNWAADYRGKAMVVYGHTPVMDPAWLNNTIDIDTGCVYGGQLTALRYPEKELVSVKALKVYREPSKPLDAAASSTDHAGGLSAQQTHDDVLDITDVLGKRLISTRLYKKITIREENAIAALEVISRFAVNPKWLIYLPPTMSPVATSNQLGLLEHPAEAFDYYRQQGIKTVMCEEKHMGSRVVVIVCRDEAEAKRRFGITGEGIGICYTRTGRRFFSDAGLEMEMLARIQQALETTDFWETFETDWVCLDCELMPWSAKAQGLLKQQYAPVGVAAKQGLRAAVTAISEAANRSSDVNDLLSRYQQRANLAERYVDAYRRYCWPVTALGDMKIAPFHILATEGKVHCDRTHDWHMQQISRIAAADAELLLATQHKVIDVESSASCSDGIQWWESLTRDGGEGIVIKSMDFLHQTAKGPLQPAVKCRGAEYLRIIYGPEYTLPENLERLRKRGLSRKRSLALREFSLGIESLERFVAHAPLRQVHECVFGVLALESEPVDPRL